MAASLLEETLRSLHQCLTEDDGGSKDRSYGLITDITQICIQEISEKEIDLCCATLLDKEKGVVTFLQKTISNDEFMASKHRILELLSEFLQKVQKKILPYALDIKDICFSMFVRDRFAKVKNASVSVLAKLIELTAGSNVGKDLNIPKLIDKFFNELTKSTSKLAATVKKNIFILLGIISEVYPELMTGWASKFTALCVTSLKTEMTSKTRKAELSIIAGSLEGLSSCLVNFTQSADERSQQSYEIFKFARMAIDPKVDYSNYDVPKAGLKLFTKHAAQFNLYLIEDYEGMYDKLRTWSRHRNKDMMHAGTYALESFLSQISEMLVTRAEEGHKEGSIFKFFIQEFRTMMNDNETTEKEVSLAIRGYGLLAAPCRTFLKVADVQFMFSEMITKSEQQFLGQDSDLEEKLHSLPSYLDALANIIRQIDEVSETYAITLERLLVLLIERIPYIHTSQHFICLRSILSVLLAIMPKGSTFQQVLSGVVYQGLIRTCSHPPVLEMEQQVEEAPAPQPETSGTLYKKITYKDYLELWTGMLGSSKIKAFAVAEISLDVRHRLTAVLYDELLAAILKIFGKLDLTSTTSSDLSSQIAVKPEPGTSAEAEEGNTSADPLKGIQPNRPKDHQIFINLVDFCKDLLPGSHFAMFERWVFTFCHTVILHSTENPLVSGFYKLLALSMKISNRLNYFKSIEVQSQDDKDNNMEVDAGQEGLQQRSTTYLLMKKFSREVLVRMKQYRDDLLASCLTFILSLPKQIIAEQMMDIVPAIQVTLNLGLSYLPLAMVALDTLEYWSATLPDEILSPHYSSILPYLDSYLKTAEKGSDELTVDMTLNITKSKSGRGRKKLPVRMVKGQKDKMEQGFESQLSKVKKRVMKYLGSLGGSINHALLANTEADISKQAIAWDIHKHLKFEMPFVDMKPTIYLDVFLPHLVELATKSSDRQTKVAACELLHSLVLFSLGRGATLPGHRQTQERFSMAPLYKKLIPSLLQLACDVEQVAKQLFESLLMQLIHWYTNNKKSESEETMTLLDAIYNGIVQPTDTALRDFCAKCLKEFLKWSIKQTTKKTEKTAVNAKSVLKRLFSYALHPSACKRLGAALAFNNIYTIFREDDVLVDMYSFQILVHFVESLAIAHKDDKSLGTVEHAKKALEHLEKIISKKAAVLCKESKIRTEPKQWSSVKLDICVRWLVRQCGRPQTECRHTCMKLVFTLSPLIPGIKSAQNYCKTFLKSGQQKYFITRFEGGGHTNTTHCKIGLAVCPTPVSIDEGFTLRVALDWFDMVLAVLDCYTWVFGESLLSPAEIFDAAGRKQTHLFGAVSYFLEKIALSDIVTFAKQFPQPPESTFYTPREIEDFNRGKCTVVIRLFNFLTALLMSSKDVSRVVPDSVWSDSLWELICSCIVQPGAVGFNLGDVEIMKNLPLEMQQILTAMTRFLPTKICDSMKKQFSKSLQGQRNLFESLPIDLGDCSLDSVRLQQLIAGYKQLHMTGVLAATMPKAKCADFSLHLFTNVFKGIVNKVGGKLTSVTLSPPMYNVSKDMLGLAFTMGLPSNVLVDALVDKTVVCGSSKGLEQSHGDIFFSMFKSVICSHMTTQADTTIQALIAKGADYDRKLSRILVAVTDYVSRDKGLRKKEGPKLVTAILSQWKKFSRWCENKSSVDLQSMAILLLTKLLLIDSKFSSTPSSPCFDDLFESYLRCLTDTRTKLPFKCCVLDLLPFFATVPKPHMTKLKTSLDRLVADNFPLKSSEFQKGSPQYKDYTVALDKILSALELSGSLTLLELLISVFCKERQHAYEDTILQALTRFVKRLPGDKQKEAIDVSYDIFKRENFPVDIRRATIEKVALPMLRVCRKSALIEFFVDHIMDIRTTVEAKQAKGVALENQIVSKMCCYSLLDVMYSYLNKEDVFTKTSVINDKFCQSKDVKATTGKEMTTTLMKLAHEAKGEDMRGETLLLELRRCYHCAAYNLLISTLSCVQTDPKFYAVFLFKEDEPKGQFVFDNLIDKEKDYEFQTNLIAPMERKKKFVSIRKEVKEKRAEEGESYSDYSSFNIASQYLADSSLHEDLNQYDFSATTSQLSPGQSGKEQGKARLGRIFSYNDPEDDQETKVTVQDDYVELEMDDLNKHECMATMIALLQHMKRAEITPPVKPGTEPVMPAWMDHLYNKMKNIKTHINVKLFIGKLISNTSEVFQPYAKFWLRPLCQLILGGQLGSGGINYYIVDMVATMLSWHKFAIPQNNAEEKSMASRLAEFLIFNVYNETRPVFRNNLELLKTLLQCWRDRIDIPYNVIYKQMMEAKADPKNLKNSTGVQVLGVVISCKFPPYGPVAPVDREKYFSTVSHFMVHHLKTVYAAASEVVGLILQYLSDKEKETEGPFHDHVFSLMTSVNISKPDNFVVGVHRMSRHYPAVADRFINKMLFMLPKLQGEFRSQCLEVIHTRIDEIENVFIELKSKGFSNFLSHRDEDTQLIALKIVKSMAAKLKPSELLAVLPLVASFSSHPSVPCRSVMYEIFMWVYDNYRTETQHNNSDTRNDDNEEAHQIMQQTKDGLLRGLGDDDLHCRLLIQNFWSSETRLPVGTLDRLVAMLEAMYSNATEQQYLSYATNLLLEMTSKSPDYQREIFEHPLSECRFSDYNVKSSWRHRHVAMTPLFASTLASQSVGADSPPETDSMDGQLQATQEVQQFTATQDASRAPFNWLTQSSLDTFSDYSTVGTGPQSALLFTVGSMETSARVSLGKPRIRPRPGFGQPKPGPSKPKPEEKQDLDDDNEILRLKRRFLKDDDASRIYFARRHARLERMRQEAEQEQKARRENQVTMYRKYRIGELPDIQIKYSYIIAPLQALAHRDSTMAKLLFSEIFKAIFHQMDQVKTEREMQDIVQQINTSLDTVLSSSTQYHPPFISCMLDILYALRNELSVDVTNVGTSAAISNLQPLGITVLEEQLIIQNPEDERSAKRGKRETTTVSTDVPNWIELARLYKSVDEYDVLLGIFSGKIGTQEITQKAVEFEARGDYHQARKCYEQALSCRDWPGGNPLDAEFDLWDDCRLECLDKLCQWTDLDNIATEAVDGELNNMWEDTFHQEHYLPFIIRSKLKLVLYGDTEQQALLDFVDSAMKEPERKSLLENRYCEELAMLCVWQEDYDRARHYTGMALQRFQQEWSSTDTLMASSRVSKLQHLQPVVELQEFLDFVASESNFTSQLPANKLIERWEKRLLHPILDSVSVWDNVVVNRNVYLERIGTRLGSMDQNSPQDSMEVDVEDMFIESKLKLKLQMVESCRSQNNYKLALQMLGTTKTMCKDAGSEPLFVLWSQLYSKTHHSKAVSLTTEWADDTFNSILSTADLLEKHSESYALQHHQGLGRQHFVLYGRTCELLTTGVYSIDDMGMLNSKNQQKLQDLTNVKKMNKSEILESLVEKGYMNMKKSLTYGDKQTALCNFGLEESYLSVALYCDKILRLKEDEDIPVSDKCVQSFPDTAVVCLLNAMKLNSIEARQRFPRLLQLVEIYPDCMDTFVDKCKEVPCWMFIQWISQMMALLDKREAKAVQTQILDIATEYPQAVVYHFKMSQEGFVMGNSSLDKKNKAAIEKLSDILNEERVPLVSKFISALEQFAQPDQIFKDCADDILRMLKKRKADKKKIVENYCDMYQQLMDFTANPTPQASSTQTSSLSSTSSVVEMGQYLKKFAVRFKKDLDSQFGKNGSKLAGMTFKSFAEAYQKIMGTMMTEVRGGNKELLPPKNLKEYCQWMADFNPNTEGFSLEIPGQYTGLAKPLPEYHVKVAGFDQRVLVMTSIRKPKRVVIRGNDEKEYPYLVKGGEDLRQDQRIEQLFHLMNEVFKKDPACCQRKLKLKTYQVVPMTPKVGLIEWISDTSPLKNFLYNTMTTQEANYFKGDQGPEAKHNGWILPIAPKKDPCRPPAYTQMFIRYNKTETVREFVIKESKVAWNLLRRGFEDMSTSPEAYHVLRCTAAVSHALLCICQYLLGIGDRHLSNFMVNLNTGQMIGIDFGHAFGSATQFLPIPELIPFRLTRQLRNLMMPLQVKGLMESTMIHALRALREDYDLLLSTMDIFVKEPSLDWLVNAEKQMQTLNLEEEDVAEDGVTTWYPKEKLKYVKRKLKGENPCYITRDEVRLGHSKSTAIRSYENVVMGDKKEDVRAKLPQFDLTVEQQVEALIDQATDKNILGRVWVGWEAWV